MGLAAHFEQSLKQFDLLRFEAERLREELSQAWVTNRELSEANGNMRTQLKRIEEALEKEAQLKRLVEDAKHRVSQLTTSIGAQIGDGPPALLSSSSALGVRVGVVRPGKAAALAGLKENDLITAIGAPCKNAAHFKQLMKAYKPCDIIPLQVLRNRVQELVVHLELGSPDTPPAVVRELRRIAKEDITYDDLALRPQLLERQEIAPRPAGDTISTQESLRTFSLNTPSNERETQTGEKEKSGAQSLNLGASLLGLVQSSTLSSTVPHVGAGPKDSGSSLYVHSGRVVGVPAAGNSNVQSSSGNPEGGTDVKEGGGEFGNFAAEDGIRDGGYVDLQLPLDPTGFLVGSPVETMTNPNDLNKAGLASFANPFSRASVTRDISNAYD